MDQGNFGKFGPVVGMMESVIREREERELEVERIKAHYRPTVGYRIGAAFAWLLWLQGLLALCAMAAMEWQVAAGVLAGLSAGWVLRTRSARRQAQKLQESAIVSGRFGEMHGNWTPM
jgi:hypothetical protein